MVQVLLESIKWNFISILEFTKIITVLLDGIICKVNESVVDVRESVVLWACSDVAFFEPVALVVPIYLGE